MSGCLASSKRLNAKAAPTESWPCVQEEFDDDDDYDDSDDDDNDDDDNDNNDNNNNNINNNTESTAVWSLKPERWESPLFQDKYLEERPVTRDIRIV